MSDSPYQARIAQLEHDLAEERRRIDLIIAATGELVYDYDVAAGTIVWRGAYTAMLGYGPEVAQTLVGLGLDMDGIITHATLKDGIAAALGAQN